MKKRIVCIVLTALMILGSVLSMAACLGGNTTGSVCTSHVDKNHDGNCDNEGCAATGIKVEHKDENHDGICDASDCGKADIAVVHTDADHDGKCDGDCKNCPPHYGYRYGRWYYGHGHNYGCERGGNKGGGGQD